MLPGVKMKANLADAIFRPFTVAPSQDEFADHLFLFTDASVDIMGNSVTVTAAIPALDYEWSGQFSIEASFTTAELTAIRLALPKLRPLKTLRKVLILSDDLRPDLVQLRKEDRGSIFSRVITVL